MTLRGSRSLLDPSLHKHKAASASSFSLLIKLGVVKTSNGSLGTELRQACQRVDHCSRRAACPNLSADFHLTKSILSFTILIQADQLCREGRRTLTGTGRWAGRCKACTPPSEDLLLCILNISPGLLEQCRSNQQFRCGSKGSVENLPSQVTIVSSGVRCVSDLKAKPRGFFGSL